ncbi:helix-turn-helix domain-containing protein [Schleiferilactobacillus perolens]|jgi:transcriptional regulator with XRE-family HTH domain|uniref:helix-turn-helix domain-containing protein n=1 Tax=Schleiferilactobacillus perolens TaxID=100468 RepID=UPI00235572B3|nr:helix-turn-helix transcriptional regulator [Schleiferilactobacillus perolens]MCI2170895.1 helix-turn-helix domain-containing protein [Schleiferilactobacillus perolens]
MAALGETIRQIRRNKGLTLAEVADDQVTASFLSKFERGVTDMGTDRFLHILNRIHTTPEEFFYIHLGTTAEKKASQDGYYNRTAMFQSLFGHSLRITSTAEAKQTLANLTVWEKEASERYLTTPSLLNMLYWRAQQLMKQDVTDLIQKKPFGDSHGTAQFSNEARQYLYNVNDWGEFEIYVFAIFAVDMRPADERRLFQVALTRSKKYSSFPGAPKLRFDIIFNQLFLEMNRQAYAFVEADLPQYADLLTADPNAEQEIWYRFIRAWWLYRTDRPAEAAELGARTVKLATTLRMTKLAQFVQSVLASVATQGPEQDYTFFQQTVV